MRCTDRTGARRRRMLPITEKQGAKRIQHDARVDTDRSAYMLP